MVVPKDLKYTPTHEWIRIEGDRATVGITDFAVAELADLAFLELPARGAVVERGERFGEIESVKTVADLIAPLSGEVLEVNGAVSENLDLLSDSPYGDGWLIRIRMRDPSEVESLLGAEAYERELEHKGA